MSSNLPLNAVPSDPSLKDLLDLLKKDVMLSLNSHHIGTVESFNVTKQTVTATINYPKTYYQLNAETGLYNPVLVDYPLLVDCPVICLGGGTTALTFPIQQGDECLVLFNDRALDNWFSGGAGAAVSSPRLHSFSDGIILVGLRSLGNVLKNYDTVRAVLRNGTTLVGVGPSLVKIANNSTTLNTLLQSLISNIQSLVSATSAITVTCAAPGNPSSPPINAAAITAVASQLTSTANQIAGLLE
jgi:hypothetical protein